MTSNQIAASIFLGVAVVQGLADIYRGERPSRTTCTAVICAAIFAANGG